MNKLFLCLLIFSGLSCQSNQQEAAPIEPGPPPDIYIISKDSTTFSIEERMGFYGVPGLSIAVFLNGNLAWAKGYGVADVSTATPVTTSTLFQAASISKPVTAMALLDLVEDSRFDLDVDINEYLTSWKLSDNKFTTKENATVRRLLNHSAGLGIGSFRGYTRFESIPSITALAEGKGNTDSIYVTTVPGERWSYSGGGYVALQIAMSDVSGLSFEVLLNNRVFTPLDMTSSTFEQPLPNHLHVLAATGYRRDGAAIEGGWHIYPEQAAAGLWTTPTDIGKFANAIQKIRRDSTEIVLRPSTISEMLSPGLGDYGLGPAIKLNGSHFGHGGSNEGFKSEFLASINGDHVVVVMTNSDNGYALNYEVLRAIFKHYGWPGF